MSYGAPDRGGGRENKKGSLRKSKVGIAEAAKAALRPKKEERPEFAPPAPPILFVDVPILPPMLDGCVSLGSRLFDCDREAVLRRARQAGVACLVVSSSDVDKQTEVLDLARSFPGTLYACVGALPDNVKRTNEKALASWVAAAREAALTCPQVVALQAGLNLAREPATHHAQGKLLLELFRCARAVRLPLVLHVAPGSLARAAELLATESAEGDPSGGPQPRLALHNAAAHCGDLEALTAWCQAGHSLLITGAAVSEPDAPGAADVTSSLGALVRSWPASMTLASGAPSFTPQTLSDVYLRTLRNEPSTLPDVARDAAAAAGMDAAGFASLVWTNGCAFFGLSPGSPQDATHTAPPESECSAAPVNSEEEEGEEAEEDAVARYACRRCRSRLFACGLALQHGCDAARSFVDAASADDNLCLAQVFVPLPPCHDAAALAGQLAEMHLALTAEGCDMMRLACLKCSSKLGRYAAAAQPCACGVLVPGPAVNLHSARLDFVGTAADAAGRALRALRVAKEEGEAAQEEGQCGGTAAPSRRKAPKERRDNRMNLSSFRNKG